MAAALDSSYTPKEIRDVPVDPAAASKSDVAARADACAFRNLSRRIYLYFDASVQKLAGVTDGIMHPGKIVAGSHSRAAELIRYICVDGCYACAEETGYPGAGGESATTSTYHSKTTKTSSKSG